jgi:hypothetical protein
MQNKMYLMISLQQRIPDCSKYTFTIPSHSWWVKRRIVRRYHDATSRVDESRFCRQWAWWTCCVHTFTAGAGWAYDYGTAQDSKEMFNYIKGYSRTQHKKGSSISATMVKDHDDRVVSAHSFKFAAELQEKTNRNQPNLNPYWHQCRTRRRKSVAATIQENVDIQAFTSTTWETILPESKQQW